MGPAPPPPRPGILRPGMGGRAGDTVIVGRDEELARFARAVDRAGEREPTVMLVSGDPGIGKSTLLAEAARSTGAALFLGRCVQVGGDAIPLAPLVDLVRQLQRGLNALQLTSLDVLVQLATG